MLEPGAELGPFRIVEPIGKGGMASVYRAYEPALDRHVTLKVLPQEFLHDPTFSERFKREAKVIARLEHRHIVPIHAFGIDDGRRGWRCGSSLRRCRVTSRSVSFQREKP